jgi:TolB-like protein
MKLSASSLVSRCGRLLPVFALLLLAGCVSPGELRPTPALAGDLRIAVLPPENLSPASAPLLHIEGALIEALHNQQGVQVVSGDDLENFMTRHRVRHTGGLDETVAAALQTELAVDAVLLVSLESYAPSPAPKIGIFARLVSAGPEPEILWTDSVGLAGDAAPGLLGLGVIDDFDLLLDQAAAALAESLALNLAGESAAASVSPGDFPPASQFRSPLLGGDLRETTVGFVLDRSLVREGETLQAEVALSGASRRFVRVAWFVSGGTAQADGVDYQAAGGVLTFPPGVTRQTISVMTRDDLLHEEEETLQLRLVDPQGAQLATAELTAAIIDNDPPPRVQFLVKEQAVERDAGILDVLVELSARSGRDVTVPFLISGTARQDVVYRVTTPSPLVIPAGERTGVIRLVIADSGPSRDDVSLHFKLGIPENALPGQRYSYLLTIRGHGRKVLPTIAVMPFLNETDRDNAGTLVATHLLTALHHSGRFLVVEPGLVRDRFLGFRFIRPEGLSVTDAELLARNMGVDLLLLGRVLDYNETGGVAQIGFSAALFERESRKVVWSATTSASGEDLVSVFGLGKIGTTSELARRMAESLVEALLE